MSHIVSLDGYASLTNKTSPRVGLCEPVNCPYCGELTQPDYLLSLTEVTYSCEGLEGAGHQKIEWNHLFVDVVISHLQVVYGNSNGQSQGLSSEI